MIHGRREAVEPRSRLTQESLRQWLIGYLAAKLSVQVAEIDTSKGFEDYGLDSSAGIEMTGKLEKLLEHRLSPALLYYHQSVDALAGFLATELQLPAEYWARQCDYDVLQPVEGAGGPEASQSRHGA
jgi:acyl carrier protein